MYTEAQRDALRDAIASGVLRVSYDGRTVEYRSLNDLRAALREVESVLNPERRTVRQILVALDKDLF
ncbi:Phage tail protein [Azospirillaceae bacterium]